MKIPKNILNSYDIVWKRSKHIKEDDFRQIAVDTLKYPERIIAEKTYEELSEIVNKKIEYDMFSQPI